MLGMQACMSCLEMRPSLSPPRQLSSWSKAQISWFQHEALTSTSPLQSLFSTGSVRAGAAKAVAARAVREMRVVVNFILVGRRWVVMDGLMREIEIVEVWLAREER
jgi:hypothetical protein